MQPTGWFEWKTMVSSTASCASPGPWSAVPRAGTYLERAYQLAVLDAAVTSDVVSDEAASNKSDDALAVPLLCGLTVTGVARVALAPHCPVSIACVKEARSKSISTRTLLTGGYGIEGLGHRWVTTVRWAPEFENIKSGGKRKRNAPDIRAGQLLATLELVNGMRLRIPAGVSGRVLAVNPLLVDYPDLALCDAWDRGWLALIMASHDAAQTVEKYSCTLQDVVRLCAIDT